MKASDRIKAICAAVAEGETVADIGTDHAYVPLILYKSQTSPSAQKADGIVKRRRIGRAGTADRSLSPRVNPKARRIIPD